MSMFSTRFLWKTSVYIAVGGMTAVMMMRSVLKDRVRQTEYFRESMKILRNHEGAKFLLGDPIQEVGFDIGNPNVFLSKEAHCEVKVRGPKNRGQMFFWASRPDDNSPWNIDIIELEVKGEEGKRLLVKKQSENEVENF